ncbi:sensor histidine kinase [Radiobacillus deserti]|nr:histidine kinase [Radiobacillus deserti]
MKWIRFKTLQKRLFAYYSIFFVTLLTAIAAILFFFYHNVTRENIINNQIQLNHAITNSINQELDTLNNFSMNLVYSNMVREHFKEKLSKAPNSPESYQDEFSEVTTLIDVILAVISSSQPAKQANIYDLNGKMVGAGEFNGQIIVNLKDRAWYEETMALHGNKYVSLLDNNQLFLMSRSEGKKHLALTRVFKNQNYVNQGIVEILQDADRFFRYPNELRSQNPNLEIYVLNQNNQQFYPYSEESTGQYYSNLISKHDFQDNQSYDVHDPQGTLKLLSYSTTDEMNWKVIVVQEKLDVFAYLSQLQKIFIILLASTLFVILIISYFVSKRVTKPLEYLRLKIRDLNPLDRPNYPPEIAEQTISSIEEIDSLHSTFVSMSEKLRKSINDVVQAREKEMDAKFLALQAQMNPHFLYNNLANISVMAEEGMNKQIVKLSENMSFMLRYISQMNKKGVKLKEEMDYTLRYLECMDIRYEENLDYYIDIPNEMDSIKIPMLIVQPLVENSIKHGFHIEPPWHIEITGKYEKDFWEITVRDNGPGFEPLVIKSLEDLSISMDANEDIPDLHIDGMGIKNILLRIKMMYRDQSYLHIQNHEKRGASITIGVRTQ